MRVALVNKFNFIKGGADKYFLDLSDLLTKNGYRVAKFAMRHPSNLPDKYSKYWPEGINFDHFVLKNFFKYLSHIFWNRRAARQFGKFLDDFKPRIAHFNNIYHHLSPSLLPEAKRRGIPIILHVHDYKLVCPNYKMFTRGRLDESCKGGRFWLCVVNRCVKNSYGKSLLAALEMWWHHKVLKVYEKNVDLYLAPSQFTKNKLVEWGLPAEKIKVLYHFIDVRKFKPDFNLGDYFLYFGRLDQEKGVDVLLKAFAKIPTARLKIVGAGPEFKNLKTLAKELKLEQRVSFVGPKYQEELKKIIAKSYTVLVPSIWFEVFGLVNLEAGALGKFVVASNIGGIPEAVRSSHTALLAHPGQVNDWIHKISWCLNNPQKLKIGGEEAREFVEKNFSPTKHLSELTKIYQVYASKD